MKQARFTSQLAPLLFMAATLSSACGSSPAGPSNAPSGPPLAIAVTAAPNPNSGHLCTGCGPLTTEREVTATLTVTETGGGTGAITTLTVTLRDSAGVVAANVEFDAASITQAAGGSNRLSALGRLTFTTGVHYPTSFLGRSGSLTLGVRAVDGSGAAVTAEVVVPVDPL